MDAGFFDNLNLPTQVAFVYNVRNIQYMLGLFVQNRVLQKGFLITPPEGRWSICLYLNIFIMFNVTINSSVHSQQ